MNSVNSSRNAIRLKIKMSKSFRGASKDWSKMSLAKRQKLQNLPMKSTGLKSWQITIRKKWPVPKKRDI